MLAKKRHNEKCRVEQMDNVGKLKAAINKDAVAFGEMLSKLLDMEVCGVCGIEESPDNLLEISAVNDILKNINMEPNNV
jgi:formate dehydrogenase assembly factor FdhD